MRPESPTSILVRLIIVAAVAMALWLSWTTVVGVVGWFARLITSMTG